MYRDRHREALRIERETESGTERVVKTNRDRKRG